MNSSMAENVGEGAHRFELWLLCKLNKRNISSGARNKSQDPHNNSKLVNKQQQQQVTSTTNNNEQTTQVE